MNTRFFNNDSGHTLFDKLAGIAKDSKAFDRFLAVVGYFRSSGYFKLRKELEGVKEIKILVGINIDDIFRKRNKAILGFKNAEEAKKVYSEDFRQDILDAKYAPEIEEGILQMCEDLASGRLEMKISPDRNLHAKFYLCLPDPFTENTDGWVIMGSSNISDSGLGISQAPRYELNVAMKDHPDVEFCYEEFKRLWAEAVPLTIEDIDDYRKKTYLSEEQPTPYELYMKVLIDMFGDQVEEDFNMQLPEGVIDLKYQKDAVIQGYQMLMKHNGLFLADVVGLGKTMVATMIAKRFIEANGKNTSVLVVYPPAVEDNWKDTFKLFGIARRAQFVTNGSLNKILEGAAQYKTKEEFDLVIVDEAHGFRSDGSGKYDELQKICKSDCINGGLLGGTHKRVILCSATPLNNRPDDLKNQLLLFQDAAGCTIDGVSNINTDFGEWNSKYKKLMKERGVRDVTKEVDAIYDEIREKYIDKVTIRRTRHNIMNDPDYAQDLAAQGIVFPQIMPPKDLTYVMDADTSDRFYRTLQVLTDEAVPGHLSYARYRSVEFLKPEYKNRYKKRADLIAATLMGIYRVHMVKRLESSFYAFRQSLHTLLRITEDMLKMMDEDKVIIISDFRLKDMMAKGIELDTIIEKAVEKGYMEEEIVYKADAFVPEYRKMLEDDRDALRVLCADWDQEMDDPKFDEFKHNLEHKLMVNTLNKEGKLVVFSESVDTLTYLNERLKGLGRTDVLMITSESRARMIVTVKENFDANYKEKKNDYNIILTSDVLAEGVNLHRANVIVNYDSPWNSTRLMQRIGRVNRIGSVADKIHNFMFYPSQQGDNEIQLYKNALIKLQGFHSAFGEDAQIYSREEIVKEFQMFDSNVRDQVDKKIALLREVRDLYNTDRKLYKKIKALPMKSRVMRDTGSYHDESLVFVSSSVKTEFYKVTDTTIDPIDFLSAAAILKADPSEKPAVLDKPERHYQHVERALHGFENRVEEARDDFHVDSKDLTMTAKIARKFLVVLKQVFSDEDLQKDCDLLLSYVSEGKYARLPRRLKEMSGKYKNVRKNIEDSEYEITTAISKLVEEYRTTTADERRDAQAVTEPRIIISETFK